MNNPYTFNLSSLPNILIGNHVLDNISEHLLKFGNKVLLITGKQSFVESAYWHQLIGEFEKHSISWFHATVSNEPSPELVDEIVKQHSYEDIACVVAIGGGSCLDTAIFTTSWVKIR